MAAGSQNSDTDAEGTESGWGRRPPRLRPSPRGGDGIAGSQLDRYFGSTLGEGPSDSPYPVDSRMCPPLGRVQAQCPCAVAPQRTMTFDASSTLRVHDASPAPQPSRTATQEGLHAILQNSVRPRPCDVYGPGPLLLSDIPADVRKNDKVEEH